MVYKHEQLFLHNLYYRLEEPILWPPYVIGQAITFLPCGFFFLSSSLLLGIDVTDTLSTAAYVDRLLMQVNQRLYLLSLLQSSGLQRSSLHLLFNAPVINKPTYALPAHSGQFTVDDKNMINAVSRKAMRRGLTLTAFNIDTLIDKSDRKLFWQTTNPGHSLHHLLPPPKKNLHLQILPAL